MNGGAEGDAVELEIAFEISHHGMDKVRNMFIEG